MTSLDYPTGPRTGFRVVFDMIADRSGWTVLGYEGAKTWRVPNVGILSQPMAKIVAMRLAR